MVSIYLSHGTNVNGASGGAFEGIELVQAVERCKFMFLGALPIHYSDTFAVGCII